MNNTDELRQLTVRELFDGKRSFSIPLYQRAYAWGFDEINTLIDDITDAAQRSAGGEHTAHSRYLLGSLVVHQTSNALTGTGSVKAFEVVDGQQRLTTLYLLLCALQRQGPTPVNNAAAEGTPQAPGLLPDHVLSFANRPTSNDALYLLKGCDGNATQHPMPTSSQDTVADPIFSGYQFIINRLASNGSERTTSAGLSVGLDQFAEQLLDHTHILLIPLPERTDLNHYFEIMNTRGVQLEAHEIAKARLMSVLETTGDESDRSAFATIWDACADMDRYVQQGFTANARSSIFGRQ